MLKKFDEAISSPHHEGKSLKRKYIDDMFSLANDVLLIKRNNCREERSSNTLYQELSFQESSILEDSSEITGIKT